MTRPALQDLINGQVRSGQLSLEDSAALAWLSASVPIDDDAKAVAYNEQTPVDFMAHAQSGGEAARASGNAAEATQYDHALDIMQRIQGQTIGIDTLV